MYVEAFFERDSSCRFFSVSDCARSGSASGRERPFANGGGGEGGRMRRASRAVRPSRWTTTYTRVPGKAFLTGAASNL